MDFKPKHNIHSIYVDRKKEDQLTAGAADCSAMLSHHDKSTDKSIIRPMHAFRQSFFLPIFSLISHPLVSKQICNKGWRAWKLEMSSRYARRGVPPESMHGLQWSTYASGYGLMAPKQ